VSEPSIWVVILAGGVGSRFWPVSTPVRPKQLLPLAGDSPLIQQTVERIRPLVPDARVRILTGERLAVPILGAVPGLTNDNLLLEPQAKGTAPVLVWAAHEIVRHDPDAVMISLHADHVIEPASVFVDQLRHVAAASAQHGRLFTIGAIPDRPETGYGYIHPGNRIEGAAGCLDVDAFVEKPEAETAKRYVAEGYLWNTGLFVWPAALLLDEIRTHTPEVATHIHFLDEDRVADYFAAVPVVTIDEGLLERSGRIAVARANFRWDDVGAWDAVARTRETDARGNVAVGNAHLVDSDDCIAWADDGAVVVYGANDLIVVRSAGITFVAPRERAPHLKKLLSELPDSITRPGEPA
jgi:mannose-1-phosphate guanylyltransferase